AQRLVQRLAYRLLRHRSLPLAGQSYRSRRCRAANRTTFPGLSAVTWTAGASAGAVEQEGACAASRAFVAVGSERLAQARASAGQPFKGRVFRHARMAHADGAMLGPA